jgi:hypothetical protein
MVDGGKGEFTVLVDGRPLPQKGEQMHSAEDVIAAVRGAGKATAAA